MTIIKHHTGAEINIESGDWFGNQADKEAAINALEGLLHALVELSDEALGAACASAVRSACAEWKGDLPYLIASVQS